MLSTRAILKRPTFVMMILAALVGFAAPAAADIEVVGNTHGDADAIRSYFAGTSEAEVQAGLEALKSSGRFSNVSVTRRGDHVIVHVSEGNLINRVAFEGNSKVKTDTLQTEMRTKAHGSFNQQVTEQDVARLGRDLQALGARGGQGYIPHRRTSERPDGRRLHDRGRRQNGREGN